MVSFRCLYRRNASGISGRVRAMEKVLSVHGLLCIRDMLTEDKVGAGVKSKVLFPMTHIWVVIYTLS